ncbi:MAG: hypothetical protein U5L03_00030 [Burkholderiaceae bacterium]|nr:hypothetical protein [Burkholderiaceae bacterium]
MLQSSVRGVVEPDFSPIENEAPLRWMRRLRLAPDDGLGAGRRALGLALLTWLPIASWALATDRLGSLDGSGESLLRHYGVHVRCLLVIPLLIVAEPMLHRAARATAARLAATAATPEARAAFDAAGRAVVRLRDATLPWVLLLGAATAWSLADDPRTHGDAMAWAFDVDGRLGFGGWWFAYVVRPVFLALLMAWLWRIVLLSLWMWRVGRIDLALVPTHPDRVGGVAVIEKLPGAFALVSMALSAMLASRWAHEILHHGASLASYRHAVVVFVVLWSLLLMLPLLAFSPALGRARKRAIRSYSALVGRQGELVHRRWIEGRAVAPEPILEAPEIGPVADAAVLYEAAVRMRRVPVGKVSLIGILLPLTLPLLVLAALQVPLKDLLLKLAKALV